MLNKFRAYETDLSKPGSKGEQKSRVSSYIRMLISIIKTTAVVKSIVFMKHLRGLWRWQEKERSLGLTFTMNQSKKKTQSN